MVSFQMKHSTRPQTIAKVTKEVDIKSFRDNPEWYELKEQQVEPTGLSVTTKTSKKTKESK
jgi:hypothetical protein